MGPWSIDAKKWFPTSDALPAVGALKAHSVVFRPSKPVCIYVYILH